MPVTCRGFVAGVGATTGVAKFSVVAVPGVNERTRGGAVGELSLAAIRLARFNWPIAGWPARASRVSSIEKKKN